MAKDLNDPTRSVTLTLSLPKWMLDYIRSRSEISPSKILREAVLEKKKELENGDKVKERLIILKAELEEKMKEINQSELVEKIRKLEEQLK